MRKIYLVKKNPELPVNGNNWIVMNGFEFMKFIQTPEGRERRKCFGSRIFTFADRYPAVYQNTVFNYCIWNCTYRCFASRSTKL